MKTAQQRDVTDRARSGVIGHQQLSRHFQTLVHQVPVRCDAQLLLEHLPEIVVAEGQGMHIGIQLVGAVGIIGDDIVFDLRHNRRQGAAGLVGGEAAAEQVAVNRQERSGFLPVGVEVEIYGVEHIQQEVVGIIRHHERSRKRNGGGNHVDMDVLEPVGTGVGMGNHRGNDDHIPGAVIQAAVVEQEGTGAAGAVNKLPAFVRVPGYGKDRHMLAHIGDFVHTGPSLRGASGMRQ